jgi:hypothetical protein
MTPPRRTRTHPDDGILEEAGTVTFDQVFAEGPVFIYVGATGDLAVVPARGDGTVVTFPSVPAGVWFPLLVTQVTSASTMAAASLRYGR